MLDRWSGATVRPLLARIASVLTRCGITANQMTVVGFFIGIAAVPALLFENYWLALTFILLNRCADGLDGALARQQGVTDLGGYLDIVLDFIFYACVICGFALANPAENALAASVLLTAFMGTGSSFLAYAILAEKHKVTSPIYPNKSLYYLGGLTEGTETICCFVVMSLYPEQFSVIAYTFATLCAITIVTRISAAVTTFR